MRIRNLLVCTAVFTVALVTVGSAFAQARGGAHAKPVDNTDPLIARFGVWDNSTNPNNVMTYEGYEKDGSKLTVSNPSNECIRTDKEGTITGVTHVTYIRRQKK